MKNIQLTATVASLTAVIGSTAMAQDARDKPPIMVRAEKCLERNAARIVEAEPDLTSAANFLVEFTCAKEVSDAARYERNLLYVASMKSMTSAMGAVTATAANGAASAGKANPLFAPVIAEVNPDTGDIVLEKQPQGAAPNFLATMLPQVSAQQAQITGFAVPISIRMLAGQLVLSDRERKSSGSR